MNQTGGKVIGQGANGVVIYPAIPCKGESQPRTGYVSRVQKTGEVPSGYYADVLEKLREIDPEQRYFYYPIKCEPGELTASNIQDGVTPENKRWAELLRFAPGGAWLNAIYRPRTFVERVQGRAPQILEKVAERTEAQKRHLIEAVDLLHRNKIAHNDLHAGNVVIAEDGLPRIIDFELAIIHDAEMWMYETDMSALHFALVSRMVADKSKRGGKRTLRRRAAHNALHRNIR